MTDSSKKLSIVAVFGLCAFIVTTGHSEAQSQTVPPMLVGHFSSSEMSVLPCDQDPSLLVSTQCADTAECSIPCALDCGANSHPHGCGNCCERCGCSSRCQKICKLVEEDRKITATCWGIACEEFCVGGPGYTGCKHCEKICDDCKATAKDQSDKDKSKDSDKDKEKDKEKKTPKVFSKPKFISWRDWVPNPCATMYTKKKLMKKTETKTVPGYKWVVEDLCAECKKETKSTDVPKGATVPEPPKITDAEIISPEIIR